jgi:hypothetical protein
MRDTVLPNMESDTGEPVVFTIQSNTWPSCTNPRVKTSGAV